MFIFFNKIYSVQSIKLFIKKKCQIFFFHSLFAALQTACESVNKGVSFYFHKYTSLKVLSLLATPWLLPFDLMYNFCVRYKLKISVWHNMWMSILSMISWLWKLIQQIWSKYRNTYIMSWYQRKICSSLFSWNWLFKLEISYNFIIKCHQKIFFMALLKYSCS